jgi:hypothetical protein
MGARELEDYLMRVLDENIALARVRMRTSAS